MFQAEFPKFFQYSGGFCSAFINSGIVDPLLAIVKLSTLLQYTPLLTFRSSLQLHGPSSSNFQAALVSLPQPTPGLCPATDLSNDCPHRSTRTKMGRQRPNTGPLGSGSLCCASSQSLCVCQRHTV